MNPRILRATLVVAGVFFGLYGYHVLRHDLHSPVANAVASVVVAWTFLAAGIVAWARRPESRIGLLMTVVAFFLLERKLQYSHESTQFTFGFLFGELGLTAAFAHAVLAYPTGRLRTRFERIFIAGGYALVLAVSLAQLFVWDPEEKCIWSKAYCADARPKNLLLIHSDPGLFQGIRDAYVIGVYGALAIVFVALIVRRVLRATPAGRRKLAPLMLGGLVEGARGIWAGVLHFIPNSPEASDIFYWWQVTGQIAVPLALLAGVLTATLAKGSVADLIVELGHTPPSGVRDVLARALGDPTLEVAFWLPERQAYVDVAGAPVVLPQDHREASPSAPHTGKERAVTHLIHDGEPTAALIHDPAIRDEPGLIEAAGEAARLSLENARLQADVRSQLAKVEESRRRIVTAGDEQRRRIERDLHDGAQQRLVALALELRLTQREPRKASASRSKRSPHARPCRSSSSRHPTTGSRPRSRRLRTSSRAKRSRTRSSTRRRPPSGSRRNGETASSSSRWPTTGSAERRQTVVLGCAASSIGSRHTAAHFASRVRRATAHV